MARVTGSMNGDTRKILDALKTFLDPQHPVSLRYCLYHLISMGVLESTTQYQKLMVALRRFRQDGDIDDECLVDNKRRVEKPRTWTNLHEYREWCVDIYRRDLWQDQKQHVEIWLEKDTTSFLVEPTCWNWGVPLRVSTGFYSRPFLYRAAMDLSEIIKPIAIYYIGDFDPSGLAIEKAAHQGNGLFGAKRKEGLFDLLSPDFDSSRISWTRLAVTEEDLRSLPDTAKVPIKQDREENGEVIAGDIRANTYKERFGEFGAEVEALEVIRAGLLAERVEIAIQKHVDLKIWKASESKQKRDKERLENEAA